jgi:hypothetical protein
VSELASEFGGSEFLAGFDACKAFGEELGGCREDVEGVLEVYGWIAGD